MRGSIWGVKAEQGKQVEILFRKKQQVLTVPLLLMVAFEFVKMSMMEVLDLKSKIKEQGTQDPS